MNLVTFCNLHCGITIVYIKYGIQYDAVNLNGFMDVYLLLVQTFINI